MTTGHPDVEEGDPVKLTGEVLSAGAYLYVYNDVVARRWFVRRPDRVRQTWVAIGVVAYSARPRPAIARGVAAPEYRPAAVPATRLEIPPSPVEPRFHAPRARSEGNFYLPRVEALPAGGEKDF